MEREALAEIKQMRAATVLLFVITMVYGIKFEVPASQDVKGEIKERCVSLFIGPHALVSGSAEAGPAFHMTTKVKVLFEYSLSRSTTMQEI